MLHKAAFSSGAALFAKIKTIFKDINDKYTIFFRNLYQQPLKLQNGQFKTYRYLICIYRIIHQNGKGKNGTLKGMITKDDIEHTTVVSG